MLNTGIAIIHNLKSLFEDKIILVPCWLLVAFPAGAADPDPVEGEGDGVHLFVLVAHAPVEVGDAPVDLLVEEMIHFNPGGGAIWSGFQIPFNPTNILHLNQKMCVGGFQDK